MAVRQDLPPGLQAAQAVHAAIGFALEFPRLIPDTVILVGVPGEQALAVLCGEAFSYATFAVREPDLDNQLTAVALEPSAAIYCRGLPLLLKGAHV